MTLSSTSPPPMPAAALSAEVTKLSVTNPTAARADTSAGSNVTTTDSISDLR